MKSELNILDSMTSQLSTPLPAYKSLVMFNRIFPGPFLIGKHKGAWYPVDSGYDRKGKSFVRGSGYVTLKNQTLAEPFVPGLDPAQSLKEYYNKYGQEVLLYAFSVRNTNDCGNFRVIDEVRAALRYPHGFFEFHSRLDKINEMITEVAKTKWGAVRQGDCMIVPTSADIPSPFGQRLSRHVTLSSSLSLFGMIAMGPHIDWQAYEQQVDDFIIEFTTRRTSGDIKGLVTDLSNESVNSKIAFAFGGEVVTAINEMMEIVSVPSVASELSVAA